MATPCHGAARAGSDVALGRSPLPSLTRTCFISGMTAVSAPDSGRVLSAPLRVAFDYTRSTGPVLGAFMTALRERRVVGIRTSDDRVVVPPVEFDPVTYAPLSTDDLVPVADHGTILTWT